MTTSNEYTCQAPARQVSLKSSQIHYSLVPFVTDEVCGDEPQSSSVGGRTHISCPPVVANQSVDTVNLTWSVVNLDGKIFERLKSAKSEIQKGTEFEAPFAFLESGSGLFSWSLLRYGTKLYPYILKHGDITLFLSTRNSQSPIPSAALSIGSLSCHNNPLDLVRQIKWWLQCCGMYISEEKVGRIDICADIKVDIKKIKLADIDRHITRARDFNPYYSHRRLTGAQFGSGDIVCRIYDKQREMIDKRASDKIIFFNDLWETGLDEEVTRFEFQLRREAIKELVGEKTDFAEVIKHIPHIWRYLTTKWLVLTEDKVDRVNKHHSRAIVSEIWFVIQNLVHRRTLTSVRARKRSICNIGALRKQARGIMLTVAAAMGHSPGDTFGIVSTITGMIANDVFDFFREQDSEKRFEVKLRNSFVSI